MGLAGFETGRSASEDAAGPPPASPVSRSRSGGAALGSAGKPPLGGGRLRSSLSDGSDAADEDPRCLIRNLDDGREYVVREEFGLREVGTGLRSIRCAAGSLVTHSRDRRSRDEKTRLQRKAANTPAPRRMTARTVFHAMAPPESRCGSTGSHIRSSVACL